MARRSDRISSDPEFLLGLMKEMSDAATMFDRYMSDISNDNKLTPTPYSKLYVNTMPYHVYINSSTTL